MNHIEETSWEEAMWQENSFLHLEMAKQVQMARALKAWVYGVHKPVKKTRTRLFEIFNPQHAKPHR